jgi:nucleoside-diphosphate-sugar epimerase
VKLTDRDLILVTGGTGLVGSHVIEQARQRGDRVRALVRSPDAAKQLADWGAELVAGDLGEPASLKQAVEGATVIVHCAAKVGDWGPTESYRTINVHGLEQLLLAAESAGTLKRFVHISSLGVYQARDHYGTDETEQPSTTGIDGYTLTKVEAENLVLDHIREKKLPAVVLRPGFIYGPRDRSVLPRLLERVKSGVFAFLGPPDKLMNNTYVKNLVAAIFLAIENDAAVGQVFNITDGRLVTKQEFVETAAKFAGYPVPTKIVPLGVAKLLAKVLESVWKLLGKKEAPLLSNARIKFLGLNLDYCIDKARRELGYDPQIDYQQAMQETIDWFRTQKML